MALLGWLIINNAVWVIPSSMAAEVPKRTHAILCFSCAPCTWRNSEATSSLAIDYRTFQKWVRLVETLFLQTYTNYPLSKKHTFNHVYTNVMHIKQKHLGQNYVYEPPSNNEILTDTMRICTNFLLASSDYRHVMCNPASEPITSSPSKQMWCNLYFKSL